MASEILRESDALAIETLFTLGLRPGEMAGLQARDVHRDRREITIARTVTDVDGVLHVEDRTKTGKTRTIPVPAELPLWDSLVAYIKERGLIGQAHLFPSDRGAVLNPGNWRRRVWGRVMKHAEIVDPPTPNSGRRTTATLLTDAGVSLPVVKAILGHSTLRVSDGYVDVAREAMESGLGRLAALYQER